MKFLFQILILSISIFNCFSQEQDSVILKNYEKQISKIFFQLSFTQNDSLKDSLNIEIANTLEKALSLETSYTYPFDSLKHLGKVTASDKKLRIYTWNLPFSDGTHKYYGFIQIAKSNNNKNLIFRLTDQSESITDAERQTLSPNYWFGCLYYQVVVKKFKGESFYTLLGFDFNNIFSSKKIVDLFYLTEEGNPIFGKPIFYYNNKLLNRVIFEFSARASMSLKYNEENDMIIYDHLSPSKPSLIEKYQYYGPDFSYDALKFEEGFWKVISDIDIRNIVF